MLVQNLIANLINHKKVKKSSMKKTSKYILPALVAAFALAFVLATPYVMAESDYEKGAMHEKGEKHAWKDGAKHDKGRMITQVDGFVGSISVPEDMDKESHKDLKDQVTVSLSEAAQGLDVMKGSIGIAVNENGEKFVVWKLVSMDKDEESDTISATITIVDAADATNKATVAKEFDHSMKSTRHGEHGSYGKMNGQHADLTPEERSEKMAQHKEVKEAFATLSEDEQSAIHSYFKGMKGQYADLTPEEREAKHTEFKQQIEAFMGLTLDEKINYLKNLALSQSNLA